MNDKESLPVEEKDRELEHILNHYKRGANYEYVLGLQKRISYCNHTDKLTEEEKKQIISSCINKAEMLYSGKIRLVNKRSPKKIPIYREILITCPICSKSNKKKHSRKHSMYMEEGVMLVKCKKCFNVRYINNNVEEQEVEEVNEVEQVNISENGLD